MRRGPFTAFFSLVASYSFISSIAATLESVPNGLWVHRGSDGMSMVSSMSADGSRIAVASIASNLAEGYQSSGRLDVWIYEEGVESPWPVSSLSQDKSADFTGGLLSANGRYLFFESNASDLFEGAANETTHIFRVDLDTMQVVLASAASDMTPADGHCFIREISSGGNTVLFESNADNLADGDTNNSTDLFLRHVESGETWLVVSTQSGALSLGSFAPRDGGRLLTEDGRFIVFETHSQELADDTNTLSELYVRDMLTGSYKLLTADAEGAAMGGGRSPSISNNGRVAWVQTIEDEDARRWSIRWMDLLDGGVPREVAQVSTDVAISVLISNEGRRLAYGGDALSIYDLETEAVKDVSVDGEWLAPAAWNSDGSRLLIRSLTGAEESTWVVQELPLDETFGSAELPEPITMAATLRSIFGTAAMAGTGFPIAFTTLDGSRFIEQNDLPDAYLWTSQGLGSAHLLSRSVREHRSAYGRFSLPDDPEDVFAGDGRGFVFTSDSPDLISGDSNQAEDVFFYDLRLDVTRLISKRPDGGAGNGPSQFPAISKDGRYVTFTSAANDLVPNDANGNLDVFVHDLETGEVSLISHAADGDDSANGASWGSKISGDGTIVVFLTTALELSGATSDQRPQIVRYDRSADEFETVSVHDTTGEPESSNIWRPRLSRDGRWVGFESGGLLTDGGRGFTSIYVRDILMNRTYATRILQGGSGRRNPVHYFFSPDSQTFYCSDQLGKGAQRFELATLQGELINGYGSPSDISSDGGRVLVQIEELGQEGGALIPAVYENGQEIWRLTNASGGPPSGDCRNAVLSPDGQLVAFQSWAGDLLPDTIQEPSTAIYVHDISAGVTTPVSPIPNDGFGEPGSIKPYISPDGRTLLFQSHAVSAGALRTGSLFLVDLVEGDSDQDGIDDGWEVTFFESLDRDGAGDFDGDGASDIEEYQAGTDPLGSGSVLRVFVARSVAGNQTAISWAATPGRKYQVEYRDSLPGGEWNPLGPVVIGQRPVESIGEWPASTIRFYRVILLP